MSQVYSTRFIHRWGTAGGVSYTVPAGKRAVIKNVTVYNGDTAAAVVVLTLNGQGIWARSVPGPSGGYSELMNVVANAGDGFMLYSYGVNSGGTVSGYLFDDLAGGAAGAADVVDELPAGLERRSTET